VTSSMEGIEYTTVLFEISSAIDRLLVVVAVI
jgi:hypothetical protein